LGTIILPGMRLKWNEVITIGSFIMAVLVRKKVKAKWLSWIFWGICFISFVTLIWNIENQEKPQRDATQIAQTTGNNSPAINQSANTTGSNSPITQTVLVTNTVVFNGQPYVVTLKCAYDFKNKLRDGKYGTRARLILDAPFPVKNLWVGARGTNIEFLEIRPIRAVSANAQLSGHQNDLWYDSLQNAWGDIRLDILSTTPGDFQIEANIER